MSILPKNIGDYRIVTQLGQGGMARALLALRVGKGGFQKLFVVKQLRLDLCDDYEYIEMFLNEAKLAALLNHPNVVQTHEIGQDLNSHFISMEYLEGQALGRIWSKVIKSEGVKMPIDLSVEVISETLAGLHYAHELCDLQGVPLSLVHRDISPGNIFVTYDGQVKLLDFGIAKIAGRQSTQIGVLKGKLSYMAPEQVRNEALDRRTDIFAMGVVLWEAMAGRPLVPRSEPSPVTFQKRIDGQWDTIESVNPNAPRELVAICNKAMSVLREDRYSSAIEMRDALNAFLFKRKNDSKTARLGGFVAKLFADERASIAALVAKTVDHDGSEEPVEGGPNEAATVTINAGSLGSSGKMKIPVNDSVSAPTNQASPRSNTVVWAIAGIVVLLGVGYWISQRSQPATTTSEPKIAATVETVQTTPVVTPETPTSNWVLVSITASPENAILELDGLKVPNPFVAKKEMGSSAHTLVVTADGYSPVSKTVNFERDGEWNIELAAIPLSVDNQVKKPTRSVRRRQRAASQKDAITNDSKITPTVVAKTVNSTSTTKPVSKSPKPGETLKTPKPTTRPIFRDNPYD